MVAAACAPAAPEVVEVQKEVPVEKVVKETVVVEKEVAVEKVVYKAQLLFWDQFGEEAVAVDQMVTNFNEAHPDIEVKRESQPNMRDILKTALDSGTGPDIIYYDTGPGFAGVLAKAGLLLPIEDCYEQYGWNERIFSWAKDRTVFDGKTYGIGHELEFIGVFYNKRIFEEEGLGEPNSHEEFIELCEKLKGGGYIPIAFADQNKWPAGHMLSVFAGNIAGKDKLAAAISGEVAWNDPDFVEAIQTFFVDMNQAGYFIPDVNAVTYDDANMLFYNGQAAMNITGTWMVDGYTNPDNMPDPVGFFFYPSIHGKPVAPPAGLGSGYFVSEAARDPDACCQFLDYLMSKEAAELWIEELAKIPPIQVDASDYDISDLMRFCIESLQKHAEEMSYNIDVVTPTTSTP
jgi:raffinose/stachyose/melibiose transport system substrate-binding protein